MDIIVRVDFDKIGWTFGLGFYHHTQQDHIAGIFPEVTIGSHDVREVILYLGKFSLVLGIMKGEE